MSIHPVIRTLREKRIERGIPQVILAERMGYNSTVVSGWENGRYQPKWQSVIDWCDALNCELMVCPRE